MASTAANIQLRPGREWKSLQDTTNDPIIAMRRPIPSRSWQRSEDYYAEGELIWLDVDTLIRERSDGKRSLDDFARAFFGVKNGQWVAETYDFDVVVETLNAVQPYDWAAFLRERLESHDAAPLDGIARGGYRLVYSDTPSDYFKKMETRRKITDLTFSLGLVVGRESKLTDVLWGGPAHTAGLTVGTQIVAVDGLAYDSDRLKDTRQSRQDEQRGDRTPGQEWRSLQHRASRLPRRTALSAFGARRERARAARSDSEPAKLKRRAVVASPQTSSPGSSGDLGPEGTARS